MILISHRGNTAGKIEACENEPSYLDKAISRAFDVEIDLWANEGLLYLGHDNPQYKIEVTWLIDRIDKLWVHCKNIEAMVWVAQTNLNYFWHETDTVTLTSKRFIWVYPGKQPIKGSIAVMPEIYNDDVSASIGICSDYIENY